MTEPREGELRMWPEEGWWVITHVETGVTTQGRTREEALDMIDEAVALHRGEIGEEPTPERIAADFDLTIAEAREWLGREKQSLSEDHPDG